jgi:hypothetical protein
LLRPRELEFSNQGDIVIAVGVKDESKTSKGIIATFNVKTGEQIYYFEECCKLCSLTTVTLKSDLEKNEKVEYIFCGTSEKKIVEFVHVGN